jgi:hypothetical protein
MHFTVPYYYAIDSLTFPSLAFLTCFTSLPTNLRARIRLNYFLISKTAPHSSVRTNAMRKCFLGLINYPMSLLRLESLKYHVNEPGIKRAYFTSLPQFYATRISHLTTHIIRFHQKTRLLSAEAWSPRFLSFVMLLKLSSEAKEICSLTSLGIRVSRRRSPLQTSI